MNIIEARRQDRINKIKTVQKSIILAKDPDYKLLAMKCCSEWGMTERYAKELIKIARYNIKTKSNAKTNTK